MARVVTREHAFCVPGHAPIGAQIVAWCIIAPRTTTFTTVSGTTASRTAFPGTNSEELIALLPQGKFGKN